MIVALAVAQQPMSIRRGPAPSGTPQAATSSSQEQSGQAQSQSRQFKAPAVHQDTTALDSRSTVRMSSRKR